MAKSVKSGSMMGYVWLLLGVALAGVMAALHWGDISALKNSLQFLTGDSNGTFRLILMGVGGVLFLFGLATLPRSSSQH